jgi:hypothetical protein
MREFNQLRVSSRSKAYLTKQQRINSSFNLLCNIFDADSLRREAKECEEFITNDQASKDGNALDELASFLSAKDEAVN